jgi:hypothetical protein
MPGELLQYKQPWMCQSSAMQEHPAFRHITGCSDQLPALCVVDVQAHLFPRLVDHSILTMKLVLHDLRAGEKDFHHHLFVVALS